MLPQANSVQTLDLDDLNKPQVRTGTRSSQAAASANPQGQVSLPNGGQVSTIDLSDINPPTPSTPPEERFSTQLVKNLPWAAGQIGKGAARGLLHTATALPAFVASKIAPNSPQLQERERMNQTDNPVEAIGHGTEQAGEFMLPGLGEERAAALLPGKLAPLGRIGYQALTSGGINAAQGGGFGTGATAGAVTGALGEGMRAAAPGIAEKALGMRGTDRAFGKTPGRAILDETSGVRPETVAASAKAKIGELTPDLERLTDAASIRRTPKLLPAPAETIPLNSGQVPRSTRGGLFAARESGDVGSPWSEQHANDPQWGRNLNPGEDFLGSLLSEPSPRSTVPNLGYLSGSEHPELSGRFKPPSGVLIRPQEAQEEAPPFVPNASASLAPARSILSEALGKATAQNAEGLHGQIGGMQDFLSRRFGNGEPIPENVTPRDLLNLKRGFSEEHLGWNPDRRDAALSSGRRAYGALDSELDRAVPEAAGLNQRISSLVPTVRRGEAMARGEGATPRIMERIARPTGALTGAIGGGMFGYQHGGTTGAAEGAGLGLILPELMSSPTGRMILARGLNRPLPAFVLPAIRGGALQFDRRNP